MTTSTKLEDQLCFALYTTSNALTRFYRPHLKRLGLTYPQYLVMLALWDEDDLMVKTLGARLGLDSGTMTPLLKRLESAGFIRRERDAQDERRVVISLSEEGHDLAAQAADLPTLIAQATGLSTSEIGALIEQLETVRHNLRAAEPEG